MSRARPASSTTPPQGIHSFIENTEHIASYLCDTPLGYLSDYGDALAVVDGSELRSGYEWQIWLGDVLSRDRRAMSDSFPHHEVRSHGIRDRNDSLLAARWAGLTIEPPPESTIVLDGVPFDEACPRVAQQRVCLGQ